MYRGKYCETGQVPDWRSIENIRQYGEQEFAPAEEEEQNGRGVVWCNTMAWMRTV
jgi:hypothetical protein